MVALFPSPYEDELLYSICARYARLMGHRNLKITLRHLFDRATVTAVADLPTHLAVLAGQLAHVGGPNTEELIDCHTLLPYFAAFHHAAQREEVRAAMRAEGHPHWLLGLIASRVSAPGTLRYCPSCVGEERGRQGEAYWHRSHQLPGVLACERHGVWLEKSEVVLPPPVTRHAFVAAEVSIPRSGLARQLVKGAEQTAILDLGRRAQILLEAPPLDVLSSALRECYLAALARRGFATFSGRLHLEKLRSAFSDFYSTDLLERLGIPADDDGWLLRLLRKPRVAAHTLHHLLVQTFLQIDREDLGKAVRPFGTGPWPCLNRVSTHYGEHLVTDLHVSYTCNARKPIGTFSCSCGFTYRRVGPDRLPEDALRLDRMASYGPVWQSGLRQGWLNPELSLRELSRQLGFDPNTVRVQAAKLGLPDRRPGSRATTTPKVKSQRLPDLSFWERQQLYRSVWSLARHEQPAFSTKRLRSQAPAAYTWLYRHDRAWLDNNKPLRCLPRAVTSRVNWRQRDAALALKLRQIISILLRAERFVRLTPGRLAREAGEAALLGQHLDRLPRCARVFAELCETREAFATRRIQVVASRLRETGERVARWEFARLAGLRQELLTVLSITQVFEQAWTGLEARFKAPAA